MPGTYRPPQGAAPGDPENAKNGPGRADPSVGPTPNRHLRSLRTRPTSPRRGRLSRRVLLILLKGGQRFSCFVRVSAVLYAQRNAFFDGQRVHAA